MMDDELQSQDVEIQSIRDEAIAFLEGRTGRFRVWGKVRKLDAVKPTPETVAWLEASILVRIAGKKKPVRTLMMMTALSELQAAHGKDQEFDAFAEMVNAYLHPLRLTPHGYKEVGFSEENNRLTLDHIGGLIARFEAIGHTVFLNSGTLLGVVRDGRLIEHDDDVDLAIVLESSALPDVAKEWVTLRGRLKELDLLDDGDTGSDEMYKLKPQGEITVDLFPCWIADDRLFIYPHTHGEIGAESLLPTQACPVSGYPIPAKPASVLQSNYGANWQKPDPYFVFPWLKQNEIFKDFMATVQTEVKRRANT